MLNMSFQILIVNVWLLTFLVIILICIPTPSQDLLIFINCILSCIGSCYVPFIFYKLSHTGARLTNLSACVLIHLCVPQICVSFKPAMFVMIIHLLSHLSLYVCPSPPHCHNNPALLSSQVCHFSLPHSDMLLYSKLCSN